MAKKAVDDVSDVKRVARMTITMPHDLKRQMDAVTEPVNWSAVAAEAFRTKLTQLEAVMKGTTMDDVVKRMKATQLLEEGEMRKDGLAAGERWAKEKASPRQLRRLARENDECGGELVGLLENGSNAGALVGVARAINGETGMSFDEAEDFWQTIGVEPEEMGEKEYAEGFVKAALGVWEAVEGKL